MANPKTGRLIAAILILIGAVLLIAAIFTPWYSTEESGSGISEYQNFYPGLPGTNGTIQFSCSGLPSGASCPPSTSYSSKDYNNTGMIAEIGFFMLIVGVIFGVIGLIFAFMSRGNSRRVAPAIALAVLAMIMAIAAVGLYAGLLPSAVGKDVPNHTGSGPWSSFSGSTSVGSGITLTWGPTTGFYIAIGAFVVLLIGVILLFLWRKEAPQPMAMPPAAPAGQGSMPPPPQ